MLVLAPDPAWVQPGANKVSGAHLGKQFGRFAERLASVGAPRFTAM